MRPTIPAHPAAPRSLDVTEPNLGVALESFRQDVCDPSERVASHDIKSLFGHLDKRESQSIKQLLIVAGGVHSAQAEATLARARTVDAARTTSGFASTAGAAKANMSARSTSVRSMLGQN